ncbi:Gag-Pro-Pol polyprotein [Dictyocoela muelleri]|nr:Gag-Pro-Pol polyprotein [Dictyocoela muelleri]
MFKSVACKISKTKETIVRYGRQYISNEFKNFMKKHDIQHIMTTPFNPTCNGISERINLTIKNILRIYKNETLAQTIKKIEINLNFIFHSIINASPIDVLNGFSIFDILKRKFF